jgi:hypothetical protein
LRSSAHAGNALNIFAATASLAKSIISSTIEFVSYSVYLMQTSHEMRQRDGNCRRNGSALVNVDDVLVSLRVELKLHFSRRQRQAASGNALLLPPFRKRQHGSAKRQVTALQHHNTTVKNLKSRAQASLRLRSSIAFCAAS